jgi:adenylate cyclase
MEANPTPTAVADEPLTEEQLADEGGASVAFVRRLVDAGFLQPDPGGHFARRFVRRVRLINGFEQAGLDLGRVRQLVTDGFLDFDLGDEVWGPPAARSARTARAFGASLGDRERLFSQVYAVLGFAEPTEATRLLVDDEQVLSRFLDVWGDDPAIALRAARLAADSMRHLVDGWNRLALTFYESWAADEEVVEADARRRALGKAAALVGLTTDMVAWLERRYLEDVSAATSMEFVQTVLDRRSGTETTDVEPAIVFADLAGYTALTERLGDEHAVTLALRLREIAEGAARRQGGRLVKLLGDGAMLAFSGAVPAFDASARLVREWSPDLPALHVGIGVGPLIERDGDYFGTTVNLAARLSGAAGPGQILAGSLGSRIGVEGRAFRPFGSLTLKGLPRPVDVVEVTVGSDAPTGRRPEG